MEWSLLCSEAFRAAIIVLLSLVVAQGVYVAIKRYLRSLAAKTKTKIDDVILSIISKPLYVTIVIAGVYLALNSIEEIKSYEYIISNSFFVILVTIFSLTTARITEALVTRWLRVQRKFEKAPQVISKCVAILIYTIALLIILDHFNISISPLVATLGLGGLAVGLALQSTLSNFFAGLHIISDRPIEIGDYIELTDVNLAGFVEDIGWRSTRIRTLQNMIVIIPNSKLAESIIINYSLPETETSVIVECGVGYGSDLEKVERVTIDVARKIQKTVPGAVKTFEPFIRYKQFGDSNIIFSVILRAEKPTDKYIITHEFIKELKKRYDKEGIEISWPVRKVYFGNEPKGKKRG